MRLITNPVLEHFCLALKPLWVNDGLALGVMGNVGEVGHYLD